MSETDRVEGDEVILHIRRYGSRGGSWTGVIVGILFIVGLVMAYYWYLTEVPNEFCCGILITVVLIVIVYVIVVEIDNRRALTVDVCTDMISCMDKKGKGPMITWGPDVHVDVKRDDRYTDPEFGPLAGIVVHGPKGVSISVYAAGGWKIEDVRRMWGPIMDLVRAKGLKVDDQLWWYLELRFERGMDPERLRLGRTHVRPRS